MTHKLYTLDNKFLGVCDERPFGFTGIVVYGDGDKFWYLYGNAHREDGPAAIRTNGTKQWFINGELHRLDGPACEYADGSKVWFLNNKPTTELECKLLYDIMKLKGLL